MKRTFTILLISITLHSFAQDWVIGGGVYGGTYFGDLSPLSLRQSWSDFHVAYGIYASKKISSNFFVTLDLQKGSLSGNDKKSTDPGRKLRNLNFQSTLYSLSPLFGMRIPLLTTAGILVGSGISFYHFEPTTTFNGEKYKLRLLNTEGQGLQGSSGKTYKNTQLALPFQGGIFWQVNKKLYIEMILQFHYTFTDYLDDVSSTYYDNSLIKENYGAVAAALADRHLEIDPTSSHFPLGSPRGNPKQNDHYGFIKMGIGFIINTPHHSKSAKKAKVICPKF